MAYRPAQVYTGSGWDDIGDKRLLTHNHDGSTGGANIPQSSVTDLTTDLADKSDYAMPKNAQTGTTYTFVLADANRLVTASNAASSTYTIPPQASVAWATDTILRVVNYGAGTVTFAGGSGVTVTNTAATLSQYQSASLIRTGSNTWTVVPFSGGTSVLTAADISSTTGSPTVNSSGGFTTYRWSSNGSITFGKTGQIDLLVVGGGQGWVSCCSGGGGGGVIGGTTIVTAGTISVVVGAGSATTSTGCGNSPGVSSFGAFVARRAGIGAGAGSATTYGLGSGVSSSITGSAVEYGAQNVTSPAAGTGHGSANGNGASGTVIVRVKS